MDRKKAQLIENFVISFNEMAKELYKTSEENGWFEEDIDPAISVARQHAELSEVFEAICRGNPPDSKCPSFSSVEMEYADLLLCVINMGVDKGYRLAEAIVEKDSFNKGRGYKHGGKKF